VFWDGFFFYFFWGLGFFWDFCLGERDLGFGILREVELEIGVWMVWKYEDFFLVFWNIREDSANV
jgi:hypothetical protein